MTTNHDNDNGILAKDNGETLAQHTLKCFKISEILFDNLPFNDPSFIKKLRNDLRLAIAIHDTGKAATGFQNSLQKNGKRWGHRHEILSAAFGSTLRLNEEIIMAVLTHHKALPAEVGEEDKGCLHPEDIPWNENINPKWVDLVNEWEINRSLFSKQWFKICNELGLDDLSNNALIRLSPLTIDKTWIRRKKQSSIIPPELRYYVSLLRGLLISSDHIASNNSINPEYLPQKIPALREFDLRSGTRIRAFQEKCGAAKGSVILRAPTGSGKTLAALLWAQSNQKKNGRLFYVLPNIASINSMYYRVKQDFGEENTGLLHSRVASSLYSMLESDSELTSKINNQMQARNHASLVREMFYPIRVCTPHQVLKFTLQGKGWETMLSEFPNSCFIFDEIHAYNAKITGLTIATVKYLESQNASSIFLSATLPRFLKDAIEKEIGSAIFIEPSYTEKTDKQILDLKRHRINFIDGNILSNKENLLKAIHKTRSTLIVCNHVPSAQIVYEEVKKQVNDTVLLHSRFCRRDRNKKERRLLTMLPRVLVSTQVVEVSLNIDFEQGFTEPAPIDALVQRFGRINRFGKQQLAASISIAREQLHSYNIYKKNLIDKSVAELSKLCNPISEEDLVDVSDNVYKRGYDEENSILYKEGLNHPRINRFKELLVCGIHHDWVDDLMEGSDDTTIDMLPISLAGEYENLIATGLRIEADNLLVPVPIRVLNYMKKNIDIKHDPWIIHVPYSEERGLILDS